MPQLKLSWCGPNVTFCFRSFQCIRVYHKPCGLGWSIRSIAEFAWRQRGRDPGSPTASGRKRSQTRRGGLSLSEVSAGHDLHRSESSAQLGRHHEGSASTALVSPLSEVTEIESVARASSMITLRKTSTHHGPIRLKINRRNQRTCSLLRDLRLWNRKPTKSCRTGLTIGWSEVTFATCLPDIPSRIRSGPRSHLVQSIIAIN